jgi:hypothetical protein
MKQDRIFVIRGSRTFTLRLKGRVGHLDSSINTTELEEQHFLFINVTFIRYSLNRDIYRYIYRERERQTDRQTDRGLFPCYGFIWIYKNDFWRVVRFVWAG